MKYTYHTKGTCSRTIEVEMEGDILRKVHFRGGCDGNLQGITKLVEGMPFHELKKRLQGINCNGKGTSCPDQLIHAMEEAMAQQNKASC